MHCQDATAQWIAGVRSPKMFMCSMLTCNARSLPNQLTIVQFVRCRPMLRVHRRAQASVGRLAEAQRLFAALLQDAAAFRCEHELMPLRDCSLNL
jgi:hypothetical protein